MVYLHATNIISNDRNFVYTHYYINISNRWKYYYQLYILLRKLDNGCLSVMVTRHPSKGGDPEIESRGAHIWYSSQVKNLGVNSSYWDKYCQTASLWTSGKKIKLIYRWPAEIVN